MKNRLPSRAEPGFARREPKWVVRWHGKKEGVHGGTTGSPVVEHDDMNVLCLGSEVVGAELAAELVRTFVNATFVAEERYIRRLEKVEEMERANA